MKKLEIKTRKNENVFIIMDDEDYDIFSKYKIHVRNTTYRKDLSFYKYFGVSYKYKNPYNTQLLHRLIMCVWDKNLFVDHINHNTLDNRKDNLRVCTKSENNRNRSHPNNFLGIKRIKYKDTFYYLAQIRHNGKRFYSKTVKTEKEAAILYNEMAVKMHKDYACLNII